jgi:hypothetical protein
METSGVSGGGKAPLQMINHLSRIAATPQYKLAILRRKDRVMSPTPSRKGEGPPPYSGGERRALWLLRTADQQ